MPTFEIELDDGRKFHIDADNHDAAVSGLQAHIGQAPEQAAARKWIDNPNRPHSMLPQFTQDLKRKIMQGVTGNWGDEAVAAGTAALTGVGSGKSFGEKYAAEKAIQNELDKRATANTGYAGTAGEMLGGMLTGGALANKGLTLVREGQSLLPRIVGAAGEGAGYGAVTGAGEADGNRMGGAVNGALVGAALGGGLTAGAAGLGAAKATTFSNLMARIDPEGAARAQVGKAMARTGKTPQEIEQAIAQARAEGQPAFTYADANPATQDMFEALMQSPGEGRAKAVDWLYGRQAEHGRRMTGFVEDALLRSPQAKKTAQQYVAGKTQARDDLADVLWPQAREGAGPVDVSGAVNKADELLAPSLTNGSGIADDTIEAVVKRARGLLASDKDTLTNFASVAQAKRDIKAIHDNNRSARYITGPMLKELDAALEAASAKYRMANDIFARQSKAIEAVDTGKQMARSGRPEDTIPAYQSAPAAQQRAMRVGYADQTVTPFYNSKTRNFAHDVTGPGVAAEIEAMAGPERAALLQRQALRENQMRSTLDKGVGGSATARRLAGQQDVGVDPRIFGMLGNLKAGNYGAAIGDVGHVLGNTLTGNTEAVRNEAIRLLLGGNVNIPKSDPTLAFKLLQRLGYAKGRTPAANIPGLLSDAAKEAAFIDRAKTRATRAAIYGAVPQISGLY